MIRASVFLAASVIAVPVGAQTTYGRTGDTLRFREVTTSTMRFVTPQGEIPMKSEHDATIVVVRVTQDSARAWYEALRLGLSSPMGNQQPSTEAALNAPFTLAFDRRGKTQLVQAPTFPAAFEGITDLSHQFDDFFLRLPPQPLSVGLAWSDTSTRVDSTALRHMRWTSVAAYRVDRDTTVDGTPAVVISMKQQVRSRSEGPVPNQPMRSEARLEGNEEGFFVFAPQAGRMLARRRQGVLEGDIVMRGAGGDRAMKQSFSYTSAIDAVRK